MTAICPKCTGEIEVAGVNVAEGVAFCRACESVMRREELTEDARPPARAADVLPKGCEIYDDGVETRLVASARSLSTTPISVFGALFCNGILSMFVAVAVTGTISHIFGWVPSPTAALASGSSGGRGSGAPGPPALTDLVMLWLLLIPGVPLGLLLAGAALTTVCGSVEVRVRGGEGVIFTGCGRIGWKRRFDATAVRFVKVGKTTWVLQGKDTPAVVLEADRTLRFGTGLPKVRRDWLAKEGRRLLMAKRRRRPVS